VSSPSDNKNKSDYEKSRLEKLRSYEVLDTLPEQTYDDITQMAAEVCDVPIALISLVDKDRLWFKSSVGFSQKESVLSNSPCLKAIHTGEFIEVQDLKSDEFFKLHPLVSGPPYARFYAGAPITTKDGLHLGTVCVLDSKTRELTRPQRETLKRLARFVAQFFEQKKKQAKADFQERLLYSIIDNTETMIFAKKMPGSHFILVSKKLQKALGAHYSEMLGKTDADFFEAANAKGYMEDDQRVFESGQTLAIEETVPLGDGLVPTFLTTKFPLKDRAGKIYGIGGVSADISQIKSIQKELEMANEELSQFAYRISHDLRAPVTGTRRLIQYILKDTQSGNLDEAQANCHKVGDLMDNLEVLLNDILALVQTDTKTDKNIPIHFENLLGEIKERAALTGNHHGSPCEIVTEISGPMEGIYFEKGRISQIIENLVSNGVKYSDSKKSKPIIKINVAKEGQTLRLKIEDNGVGIDPKYHDLVFTMFERFHPELGPGSGLGLYVVKKHVEYLNGQIRFESSDQGTTFFVELPIQASSE